MKRQKRRTRKQKIADKAVTTPVAEKVTEELTIRLATDDDLMTVLMLVHKMGADYPIPIDDSKVLSRVQDTIKQGLVLLVLKDMEVVATTGLIATDWWFSQDMFLRDVFTVIHPKHRSLSVFKALMEAVKELSDKMGLPVVMGVMTPTDTKRKIALYERYMDCWGATFTHGFNKDD